MRSRFGTLARVAAVAAIVWLAYSAEWAVAADGGTMSVGPSKITMSLMKGSDFQEVLRIENDSDFPMRIALTPWNFAYDAKGQIHAIADIDADRFRGAAKWVAPVKPQIVQPHTEATMPVNVTVPKDASVGTHSAYLRVTGVPIVKSDAGESLAKVKYRLNGLLLVVVQSPSKSETLNAGAKIVSFATSKRFMLDDPVPFVAKIDNTGNVHLDLQGKIVIKNASGKLVETLPVLDHTLLPESVTTLDRAWQKPPLIGKFTAQLLGTCGIADMTQDFESDTVEFWYVSKPLLYGSIGAIVGLLALWLVLRKRFRFRLERVPEAAG